MANNIFTYKMKDINEILNFEEFALKMEEINRTKGNFSSMFIEFPKDTVWEGNHIDFTFPLNQKFRKESYKKIPQSNNAYKQIKQISSLPKSVKKLDDLRNFINRDVNRAQIEIDPTEVNK
jgi:DNA-binding cell septation regulator SpoVG